jgi:protein TonB
MAQATPPAPPSPPPPPRMVQPSADLSYRQRIPPRYPPQARRLHHEGTVILLVLVGTDGSPKQVKVDQSSGYHELDRAAVQAAKRWKFNPGTRNGVPYETWGKIPVRFKLGGY